MKKLLASIFVSLSMLLPIAVAGSASAAVNIVPQCGSTLNSTNTSFCSDVTSAKRGTASDPVINIIRVVIEIISYITGIAAMILIIISAIKFVTSGGDSQKVSSARGSLINALIGIVITIVAQAIVVFVLNNFNN
jgi:phosphotransferase system  glucose/maltose/N-acetylglucosamine-specific IIC component